MVRPPRCLRPAHGEMAVQAEARRGGPSLSGRCLRTVVGGWEEASAMRRVAGCLMAGLCSPRRPSPRWTPSCISWCARPHACPLRSAPPPFLARLPGRMDEMGGRKRAARRRWWSLAPRVCFGTRSRGFHPRRVFPRPLVRRVPGGGIRLAPPWTGPFPLLVPFRIRCLLPPARFFPRTIENGDGRRRPHCFLFLVRRRPRLLLRRDSTPPLIQDPSRPPPPPPPPFRPPRRRRRRRGGVLRARVLGR